MKRERIAVMVTLVITCIAIIVVAVIFSKREEEDEVNVVQPTVTTPTTTPSTTPTPTEKPDIIWGDKEGTDSSINVTIDPTKKDEEDESENSAESKEDDSGAVEGTKVPSGGRLEGDTLNEKYDDYTSVGPDGSLIFDFDKYNEDVWGIKSEKETE